MALARRVEDRLLEASALVQLASASQWLEDFPAALQRAQEAVEIAEAVGAPEPLGGALFVRSYVHSVSGKLDVAEAGLARALEIGRAQGDRSRVALTLMNTAKAWSSAARGFVSDEKAGSSLRF